METKPKRIARTKVNDYMVNTTQLGDKYETAVKLEDRDYIIVQNYTSLASAEVGHKHWCRVCEDNPIYATDVNENKQKVF